jgi:GNAT superfamily N-acetyltransferase
MDDLTIRPAELRDLHVLLAFEQAMIEAERPFDPTIRSGADVRYYDLEKLLASPEAELLVVEIDLEIIATGYARIERSEAYLKHRQHSYLGFMYVVPEHRGKGINQRMIGKLEEWSRSRGVTEMSLEVYSANVAAIRAYEKSGYAALIVQMRKEISR